MGGDKIVLLDGAGANGGGAATNGLLSMNCIGTACCITPPFLIY